MVWGLFPADLLSGDDKYYILAKGTYKIGRKGCDIIIDKDKGVSRVHAELVIDEMISLDSQQKKSSKDPFKVRIRDDWSKYGTFINRNFGTEEKVSEYPNKETILNDGDLVSLGTGNATYRFCYVPLVFLVCRSETSQVYDHLQDIVSSIGACITHKWNTECTHVLVNQLMPFSEEFIDAIVAKKPFVLINWVEVIAEKSVLTEIPSCSSYLPTLTLDGALVKVSDSDSRQKCLEGYTLLLESAAKYKFGDRLQLLLEAGGAEILLVDVFGLNRQDSEDGKHKLLVYVVPARSADEFSHLHNVISISRVDEMKLICAVLSGHLDPSILMSQPEPVVVSSSCSTDETVVADSDEETETIASCPTTATVHSEIAMNNENIEEVPATATVYTETAIKNGNREDVPTIATNRQKLDEPELGNSDIIYSQVLVVRDMNLAPSVSSKASNSVVNFKRFRKTQTQSGNSFNNLIPFSKYPYKDYDNGTEEAVAESMKEEKRRKQMEAVAEEMFNNERVLVANRKGRFK